MTAIIPTRLVGVAPARRSAREWRALLRTYARSNETRQQFCARHGVALSTFDRWRQRLRQEAATGMAVRASVPAPALALFVELAADKQPVSAEFPVWDMELELGHGVFLRLRRAAC